LGRDKKAIASCNFFRLPGVYGFVNQTSRRLFLWMQGTNIAVFIKMEENSLKLISLRDASKKTPYSARGS
jgi:hypothetical protein